jgi:hypothetical protein
MIDPECAICSELITAIESLEKIVGHIEWGCQGSSKKSDFGLTKKYIIERVGEIKKMQKWHEYFHSTGESLMDTNRDVNSGGKQPRRWRKP